MTENDMKMVCEILTRKIVGQIMGGGVDKRLLNEKV